MMSLFLNIWFALPLGWRRFLTIAPISVSVLCAFLTWDWLALIPGAAISLILFLLPGASEAEKKGYHF